MDNLYDLCCTKLVGGGSAAKPRASTGGGGKKKGTTKKVKIDEDANLLLGIGGGTKRRRSFDEDEYVPRPSTSRSTRSSPSADDSAPPRKKKKVEKKLPVMVPVLKVPPKVFPTEIFDNKDVDPSTPEELNTMYTPDGPVPVVGNTANMKEQKYQPRPKPPPLSPKVTHFFACVVCGVDNGEDRIACKRCPRLYHKTCLETEVGAETSSDDDEKKECKRCEKDKTLDEEEMKKVDNELTPFEERKKVMDAFEKYKDCASNAFMTMILGQLLQILKQLKWHDYGDIFCEPGKRSVVCLMFGR